MSNSATFRISIGRVFRRAMAATLAIVGALLTGCSSTSIPTPVAAAPMAAPEGPTQPLMMPDNIPSRIQQQMLSTRRFIGSPGLAWRRRVVTVAFNGGSDPLYEMIERTASEWTSSGGQLQLSFRDAQGRFRQWSPADRSASAAIRVSFRNDPDYRGYWSVVGSLAQSVGPGEPTLNLENFPQELARYFNGRDPSGWAASYEHSVILHEFGHALGLSHEHFHPVCQADLNIDLAIRYLTGPPNDWKEDQARFNVDSAYYFNVLAAQSGPLDSRPEASDTIDRNSVMLYSFEDRIYRSGSRSPCKPAPRPGFATSLSATDRAFFMKHYDQMPGPS